jgi:hypothetical protein
MPSSGFDVTPVSQPIAGSDDELVMDMLSAGQGTIYSFQGMRRKLGLHQEKLTRILKRLEDDNLVMKTNEGYTGLRSFSRKTARHDIVYGEPVIRGHLPTGTNLEVIMSRLKGRWFKNFRWLGYTSNDREQSMYWITEDGRSQVRVQLTPLEILVWSENATGSKGISSPLPAAYELFDRISHLLPESGGNS